MTLRQILLNLVVFKRCRQAKIPGFKGFIHEPVLQTIVPSKLPETIHPQPVSSKIVELEAIVANLECLFETDTQTNAKNIGAMLLPYVSGLQDDLANANRRLDDRITAIRTRIMS